MFRLVRIVCSSLIVFTLFTVSLLAAPVTRTASGANAAAIQATVDQFRADLGGANNGIGNSFTTGRREINWDGVADSSASPNDLPFDFFNINSPRGVVFDTTYPSTLRVSADSSNPTSTAVRFGDIDPSYTAEFSTFSAQRLFAAIGVIPQDPDPQIIDIVFYIPGTKVPATVSGFGVVFSDVDLLGHAAIICYGTDGTKMSNGTVFSPVANSGLSFTGISFNAGERISRVRIVSGSRVLAQSSTDSATNDMVVMDDLIYGEPRAAQYHTSDFDGDGTSDFSVFRPSTGTWFVLNSGSSTVTTTTFGQNGDLPIDADFDGDQRADIAVWRPSTGTWFFKRSSDNTFGGATWGQAGDKPVPGDYDKDGKTDLAVWRPSDGINYIVRSSDNSFFGVQWGVSGDIPVMGAAQ